MKRIALVGCGRISVRHIEAIEATPGVEIALVCDCNEAKAKATAEKLGVPYLTDYKLIRDVDAIAVLTPSGHHPKHVMEIAEYTNVPIILSEKPISLTVREALEMSTFVESKGKRLLPIYQNRYNPLVAFIREMIHSGKLGKIYQFNCNSLWNRNDAYFGIDWHGTRHLDGGVLYTQASHYVDMVHYFFGKLIYSQGVGGNLRQLDVYDTVSAVCQFENGALGTINATVSVYETNYLTEFVLVAENGTIRLNGTNLNKIDFWNVEGMEKPDMDFTIDHQYGKGHDTMYEYIVAERYEMFPTIDEVVSGISLMEKLAY
ncbi:MAG: Gfo/Idh/MocA family oxidoreductase [Bacteroidales bacterium]